MFRSAVDKETAYIEDLARKWRFSNEAIELTLKCFQSIARDFARSDKYNAVCSSLVTFSPPSCGITRTIVIDILLDLLVAEFNNGLALPVLEKKSIKVEECGGNYIKICVKRDVLEALYVDGDDVMQPT